MCYINSKYTNKTQNSRLLLFFLLKLYVPYNLISKEEVRNGKKRKYLRKIPEFVFLFYVHIYHFLLVYLRFKWFRFSLIFLSISVIPRSVQVLTIFIFFLYSSEFVVSINSEILTGFFLSCNLEISCIFMKNK